MHRYALYIFDLDGTLYRGTEAIPGAAETLDRLRRSGSTIRFLTNNSSLTPKSQSEKLIGMGIQAAPAEITTSGTGAAAYLARHGMNRPFVVGEPGLFEVLAAHGVHPAALDERCDAVLAGICRTFTYDILDQAMQRILDGAPFIATNADASYPREGGRLIPGAGAIVSAIKTCSGKDPLVLGKPNPYLIEGILSAVGVDAKETLVVGDRYETDIVCGLDAGCDTLLVMSGVTREVPAGQPWARDLREIG